MHLQLVDPTAAGWAATLDSIGYRLRQPEEPALLPYHFLHVTFGRIGGLAVLVRDDGGPAGAGFLFPRQRERDGSNVYTLRYHPYPGRAKPDKESLCALASELIGGCAVVFYDPYAPQFYAPSHHRMGSLDVGRPHPEEAGEVPTLHQRIWGSPPEFLYPADVFSVDFAAGTGLVARVENENSWPLAGFLIGFHKFGGSELPADWHERFGGGLRLESQIIGVLPAYRGLRIASLLKLVQSEQAWREGLGVINWTADPLQFPNAVLNFGVLRAVAFDYVPDMYPFRNNLNRLATSRFLLTWLIGSRRVRDLSPETARSTPLNLAQHRDVERVNDGFAHHTLRASSNRIAIEIPADWTRTQSEDFATALRWREVTDRLFARYVGLNADQYTITGVGVDGDRRFIIGEQSCAALWDCLGAA